MIRASGCFVHAEYAASVGKTVDQKPYSTEISYANWDDPRSWMRYSNCLLELLTEMGAKLGHEDARHSCNLLKLAAKRDESAS